MNLRNNSIDWDVPDELSASLRDAIDTIRDRCSDCEACKTQCAFLQEYGTPIAIIGKYDFSRPDHQAVAFECSLCSLCGAVCPENLEPGDLFYAIRREAMNTGKVNLSRYRAILGYEKCGSSPLFSTVTKFLKIMVTDWSFRPFTRLSAPGNCLPVPQEAVRSSCMTPARCAKRLPFRTP